MCLVTKYHETRSGDRRDTMDEHDDGTGGKEQLRDLARRLGAESVTIEQSRDHGRSVQDERAAAVSRSVRRSMAADGLGADLASTPPDGLDSVDTTRQ